MRPTAIRCEPNSWLASWQPLPRLDLDPRHSAVVARSRHKTQVMKLRYIFDHEFMEKAMEEGSNEDRNDD